MTRLLIVLVCAALLAGCGKHYWSKPGGTEAGFAQDHRAQQVQPAADAFRGIEGDEIVRVDSPPPPR